MKKKLTVSTAITLIILAVALTISVTMLMAMRYFNRQVQDVSQRQTMYAHINDVDQHVRDYYRDLDEEVLRQGITAGYINGIGDKYAAFFTAGKYAAEQLRLSGFANDVGIGVWNDTSGNLTVATVNQDSAAAKAGVKVGDVITAIDGEEIGNRTAAEIQRKLDVAEKVLISVSRDEKAVAFDLAAYQYALRSVQNTIQDTIAHVKITAFYQNTPDQFKATISYLLEKGVTGIVFDLRDNKGGLLDAAEQMLVRMLPLGMYGTVTDADGNVTNLTSSVSSQIGVPTVTLVNGATAGEAEFFAGVLQEFGATTVVGETTAGKAKYQEYFMLEADGSAIKLTVGEMGLLKSGSWEGVGIIPTQEVTLTELQKSVAPLLTKDNDTQLLEAMTYFGTSTSAAASTTTGSAATSTTTAFDAAAAATAAGSTTTGSVARTTAAK